MELMKSKQKKNANENINKIITQNDRKNTATRMKIILHNEN